MGQGLAEGLSLQGRFGGGQIDPGSELMKGMRLGQGLKQKQDQNKARYNDLVGIKDPAQVHALYRDQYKQTGTEFLHELADAKQKNPRLSQSQANEIAFKYKEKLARLEKQSKNAQSLQDELIKNDRLGYRDVGQAIATGDWNKLREYHGNPLSGVRVSDQGDLYVDAEKPQNLSEYVDKNVHDQKMFSGFYTKQGKRIKGDAYGDTYQYSMPDEKVQEQAQLSFTPQVYRQVVNQSPDEVQNVYDNMLRDASEQGMDTRDPMVQQQLQQAAAFNVYQTKYVKPRQVPIERDIRKQVRSERSNEPETDTGIGTPTQGSFTINSPSMNIQRGEIVTTSKKGAAPTQENVEMPYNFSFKPTKVAVANTEGIRNFDGVKDNDPNVQHAEYGQIGVIPVFNDKTKQHAGRVVPQKYLATAEKNGNVKWIAGSIGQYTKGNGRDEEKVSVYRPVSDISGALISGQTTKAAKSQMQKQIEEAETEARKRNGGGAKELSGKINPATSQTVEYSDTQQKALSAFKNQLKREPTETELKKLLEKYGGQKKTEVRFDNKPLSDNVIPKKAKPEPRTERKIQETITGNPKNDFNERPVAKTSEKENTPKPISLGNPFNPMPPVKKEEPKSVVDKLKEGAKSVVKKVVGKTGEAIETGNRTIDRFNKIVGIKESGGDYTEKNKYSSAVGKYQHLWETHKDEIKKLTGVETKEGYIKDSVAQEKYQNHLAHQYVGAVKRLKSKFDLSSEPDEAIMMLVHFLGEGDAKVYLKTLEENGNDHKKAQDAVNDSIKKREGKLPPNTPVKDYLDSFKKKLKSLEVGR